MFVYMFYLLCLDGLMCSIYRIAHYCYYWLFYRSSRVFMIPLISSTARLLSTLFPYTTLFRSVHYPKLLKEDEQLYPRWKLQPRSEEHTSELQSRGQLVCRLLLEKKIDYHVNFISLEG